jgi:predicted transglutaminase-like cysteine proteinase
MEDQISKAMGKSDEEKLIIINDYYQDVIKYQLDEITWSQTDYWATPAESLAKKLGDCEDFAIAKYLFLLRVGIPASKLRLIYVKAKIGGRRSRVTQAHMVLGYYKDGSSSPLILDSLISEVLPAEQRTDLIPVFSFNTEGLWAAGQKKSAASPTARLSRWRNVLQKLTEEGLSI